MRRGFTLIELAIVFVVIGLVIGAIIVANSMVDTAKVENAVRQTAQFDVAASNFQTKYQKLPGDAPAFQFQTNSYTNNSHGNGNGLIEDDSNTNGLGAAWTGEVANFWVEMNAGGFKSEVPYTAVVNGGKLAVEGTSPNMPAINWGIKGTGVFATNDTGELSAYNISGVYIIGKVTNNDGTTLTFANNKIEDALTTVDLLAFDKKVDDGNPQTGNVIAFSHTGTCFSGAGASAVYNADTGGAICSAAVRYLNNYQQGGGASGVGGVTPCTGGNITCATGTVAGNVPACSCSDTVGCVTGGGTWDSSTGVCTPGGGGGSPCTSSDITCSTGTVAGTEPACSCSDTVGCVTGGGTWDSSTGVCTPGGVDCGCGAGVTCYSDPGACATAGGSWDKCGNTCACPGSTWNNSQCESDCGCGLGVNCTSDPGGCASNGGSWNQCSANCSCPSNYSWDGSNCTPIDCGCGPANSCTGDPGGCGPSGGTWSQCGGGSCTCPNNGTQWNGSGCVLPDCGCGAGQSCYTDPGGCVSKGGTWSQCANSCSNCPYGNLDGQNCNLPPTCGNSCAYGSQEGYPSCICDDPGCYGSGGTWDNGSGNCTCQSGSDWTGSACVLDCGCGAGVSCFTDPGCAGSGGTWNQCANSCTCSGEYQWTGSTCQAQSCDNNQCYGADGNGGCTYQCTGSYICNGNGNCVAQSCDATQCMTGDGNGGCISQCTGNFTCNGNGSCVGQSCDQSQCQGPDGNGGCAYECSSGQNCGGGSCYGPCDPNQCQSNNGFLCIDVCAQNGQTCDGNGNCQ